MLWGHFSSSETGLLIKIEERMDGKKCRGILQDDLSAGQLSQEHYQSHKGVAKSKKLRAFQWLSQSPALCIPMKIFDTV